MSLLKRQPSKSGGVLTAAPTAKAAPLLSRISAPLQASKTNGKTAEKTLSPIAEQRKEQLALRKPPQNTATKTQSTVPKAAPTVTPAAAERALSPLEEARKEQLDYRKTMQPAATKTQPTVPKTPPPAEKPPAESVLTLQQMLADAFEDDLQSRGVAGTEELTQALLESYRESKAASGKGAAPAPVVKTGDGELYDIVSQLPENIDLTDWEKKKTQEQRNTLKHSGLTDAEQWTLLNADEYKLEALQTIAEIQQNRRAYGLSQAAADKAGAELLNIAAARKNVNSGRTLCNPRDKNIMLSLLDSRQEALLAGIGYGTDEGAGSGSATKPGSMPTPGPVPTPGPTPTPTRKPQTTLLPQPGPSPVMTAEEADAAATRREEAKQALLAFMAKVLLPHMDTGIRITPHVVSTTIIQNARELARRLGKDIWLNRAKAGDGANATWDDSIIEDQAAYSQARGTFGPLGSIEDNGCGAIMLNNVNAILGEKTNFADIAYDLNSNWASTTNVGGHLGMNPNIVGDYYREKGYDVKLYTSPKDVPKTHDAYAVVYFYPDDVMKLPAGGHYVALQYDPQTQKYISMNDPDKNKKQQTFSDFVDMKKDDDAKYLFVWGIDKP